MFCGWRNISQPEEADENLAGGKHGERKGVEEQE